MLDEVLQINLQAETQFPAVRLAEAEPVSDDRLVESVLAGDESAFAEIFERYKRPVTRTVGRFFYDRAEVEEHVQLTFAKCFFSLKNYHGGEQRSFHAWLIRIAVNVCYDEFRRRQRRPESGIGESGDGDASLLEMIVDRHGISPEDRLVAAQLAERLLSGLDARDRVAMTLVYSEDYTLSEVAEAIGITTSNLKSRLFRCRNHIRTRFGHLFR